MVDSVLIVGGGVAGIQAALDCAAMGVQVTICERSTTIGGTMAELDKTFPTNDCSMCILSPKLVEVARNDAITVLTSSRVTRLKMEGRAVRATIERLPTYVDAEKCVGCGSCADSCPVRVPNEYDHGLSYRKAIYLRFPQAVPLRYTIDPEHCLYLTTGRCRLCERACEVDAIDYDDAPRRIENLFGAVIVATGAGSADTTVVTEYGLGTYPNVVSNIQFERILCASGPFGGTIKRPSDKRPPKKIAMLLCAGSRDTRYHSYCASVCCMAALKQSFMAVEHDPSIDIDIFGMEFRCMGKDFEEYLRKAERHPTITLHRQRIDAVSEHGTQHNLRLRVVSDPSMATTEGSVTEAEFDLVVLAGGLVPAPELGALATACGIDRTTEGFIDTARFTPLRTTKAGVFVCGTAQGPKDIPDSVAQGSGAASHAVGYIRNGQLQRCVPNNNSTVDEDEDEDVHEVEAELEAEASAEAETATAIAMYEGNGQPDLHRSTTARSDDELEPRIGLFVCRCGTNIAGNVEVDQIVEQLETLPDILYCEATTYTCSQDTQERMKTVIAEHRLNRVVVAACTPRTHEPLFRATLQEAGLNPYLFEMANIREQCSWVHMDDPERATEKARDLVRIAIAKARLLEPLEIMHTKVDPHALVIGGGLAGMTTALQLAKQGFESLLIEREPSLGGNLTDRSILIDPDGTRVDARAYLETLIDEVNEDVRITVCTNATIESIDGYVGNFETKVRRGEGVRDQIGVDDHNDDNDDNDDHNDDDDGDDEGSGNDPGTVSFRHGVVIVATGGEEYRPTEYGYGTDDRIVTQTELGRRLCDKPETRSSEGDVVMIQCVGSRTDENPTCSRVCCIQALSNALLLKRQEPERRVDILHRGIRAYGLYEALYRRAQRAGVGFVRFEEATPPRIEGLGDDDDDDDEANTNANANTNTNANTNGSGPLTVWVEDAVLGEEIVLNPSLVVLSTGIRPRPDASHLASELKVPLDRNSYFLEAHVKLRPVDFATAGVFLCGIAHGPKLVEETVAQAAAAAARAGTILARPQIVVDSLAAVVDQTRCGACGMCVNICPYQAPSFVEGPTGTKVAWINPALCKGCGLCVSSCPDTAIDAPFFSDLQLRAQLDVLGAPSSSVPTVTKVEKSPGEEVAEDG